MSGRRIISAAAMSLCVLSTSACGAVVGPSATASHSAVPVAPSSTAPVAPSAASSPSTTPEPSSPATSGGVRTAGEDSITEIFEPANFTDPTAIDNLWLPWVPGTQWTFEGSATRDGERIKRRVVNTTTNLTKVIDGTRTVVNYELDYDSGQLVEAELVFFSQDDDGTIWLMGEYPEEYEDGTYVESKPWLAGLEDAKAGIMMMADPQIATPSYSEGWGPKVGWTDRGRVFEMGSKTCVRAGCYTGVLVIDEFNRDEPDAHQLKYYASGVGGVRVGWAGSNEEEQETLELVKVVHLAPDALAKAGAAALALEAHAYAVNKDVYGKTESAQQR
jgi:hypothetical protein